jgi:hypothetical protein
VTVCCCWSAGMTLVRSIYHSEGNGEKMYHFKITTDRNIVYEGLSANRDDLMYLVNKKVEINNLTGTVEIFNGKKKIEEYKI